MESFAFIELKASFPGIPEAIGPFAGIAVFLMPDEFLGPKPVVFPHFQNQVNYIGMPFTVDHFFFNVKDEGSGRFQYPKKLMYSRHKPANISIWMNPPIGGFPAVRIGRGGNDQVKEIVRILPQNFKAIAANNLIYGHNWLHLFATWGNYSRTFLRKSNPN